MDMLKRTRKIECVHSEYVGHFGETLRYEILYNAHVGKDVTCLIIRKPSKLEP